MEIIKKHIIYNHSRRYGKILYIVIHDTGNSRRGAGALNHYLYFNGGVRWSSAHYFIDDKMIVETVPINRAAWHVGDGKGKYGVKNDNSVGIEICINQDSDYKLAFDKTVELTRYLMKKLGIPHDRIIRHYDASRKICPMSMSANNWKLWEDFKKALTNPSHLQTSRHCKNK